MSDVWEAYLQKYKTSPNSCEQLMNFSKTLGGKSLTYKEAKDLYNSQNIKGKYSPAVNPQKPTDRQAKQEEPQQEESEKKLDNNYVNPLFAQSNHGGADCKGLNESEKDADGKMQIYAKTLTSTIYTIRVSNENTILDVKNQIEENERIPHDQQRLIFQGKQLEDDRTLSFYKIEPYSSLQLVLHLRVAIKDPDGKMEIFAKTSTGKTIILRVSNEDTLLNVKNQIARGEGIPPDRQLLIFGDKQLKDDLTLSFYKIGCYSTIQLFTIRSKNIDKL